MSKLSVKTIRPKTGSAVQIASNTSIALGDNAFASSKGTPVQFVTARYDGRQSFTASPNNQNSMPNTNISVTPKYTGSLLSVKWMLSGEVHQDVVILIMKNGVEFKSHSTSAGSRWSGYCSGWYDRNQSSTMSNWYINVFDTAVAGQENTYGLAVRSSSNGTYTFYLNRTQGALSQNSYENGCTISSIMEIVQ
ncbi:tail fiber protein [Synechococcus phage ACG-2014j]|jgi:hypothetical protein|uniref:Uncharacterized protein n=1 Tax=Synechococcus phage ACG-2014j TaxID=1493514 RepID=A0A0E3FJY9_9CAUD|nr:tail fiber protein [Synechococcus phage ACG-2014j]AIX28435.1 hypothetical protein Syn7803US23_91 [Synechococcus phage ACG-2014j]